MSTKSNSVGIQHAHALVKAGKVNRGTWDFTAEDGNKLLGPNGDDWANYAQWFLAVHPDATEKTKAHYGYPFGKDGEVYHNAVVSAKGRAAQQGATDVEAACSSLLDAMDGKKSYTPFIMKPNEARAIENLPLEGAMQRAYSRLDVKAVTEDENYYYIDGIATTPTPDRMGDVVDPMGAKFALPLPLLWQHDANKPIGSVSKAKMTKAGIPITAQIPKVKEAGTLQDRINEAVQSIKYKLVAGLSIGFQALNNAYEFIENGGMKFKEWEWLELSCVTIPANSEATISVIKSLDQQQRAASGKGVTVRAFTPAGVTAKTVKSGPEAKKMNVQDQIKQFQTTRAAKAAALEDIVKKSAEAGETLDAEQSGKFEELEQEIKTIDTHLGRLETTQKLMAGRATKVELTDLNDSEKTVKAADASRQSHERVIAVAKKDAPGIGFARFVKCMAANNGDARNALDWAKENYPQETPLHEVIKMHVGQGQSRDFIRKTTVDSALTSNSAWAGALVQYQILAQDFIEFLRPQTIIGKINGFRRVPFKVKVPRQTSGGSASWVGEGKAKPLTSLAFDTVTLDFTKLASIAVIPDEVIRLSSPSADTITRDQLAQAIINQMDSDFIDPSNAGSGAVKPASITNGATSVASTGTTTQAGVATDILNVFAPWLAANVDPTGGYWVMTPTTALALSLMQNSLGQKVFPGVTVNGGDFSGLPVVTSQAAGLVGASDGAHIVVLLKAGDILLADDGTVAVDASREASLEMSDSPSSAAGTGTGASLVSMFQTNCVAIRAERWINWVKARSTAAVYLTGVHWGGFPV